MRLAWRRDWSALWREAAAVGQKAPVGGGRANTPVEDARAVTSLVRDGLLSKALGRVMSRAAFAVGSNVLTALGNLFPAGVIPDRVGGSVVTDEVRERLFDAT